MKIRGTCLLGLAGFFIPVAAQAQTPSPLAEWQYSPGHVLQSMFVPDTPKWERTFGLATEALPKYEGANAYRIEPGPTFDVRYYDIAFASTGEGFGVNVFHGRGYRAGAALTYDLGRDQDDDHHLKGLGDIAPSAEIKLFGEYVIFPLVLRADARYGFLGGHGGWIGDVSAYLPIAGSEKFFIFVGPSVTFANTKDMRHAFGVSDKQALNSGYPQFSAHGGLRSAAFGVSSGYFLTKHWLVDVTLAAEKLLGDAGRSPIIQEQGQFAASATVDYRY